MSQNIIQIVVTWHGGMSAISYEWGSKNHMPPFDKSPDDLANVDIAKQMRLINLLNTYYSHQINFYSITIT